MPEIAAWVWRGSLLGDQSEVLRNLARGFPVNQPEPGANRMLTGMLFLAAFAALVWLLARLAKRHDRRGSYNDPRELFRSLCQVHRLDAGQRKLLERLAQFRQLEHPAVLFLERRHFDAAELPQGWQMEADKLEALRDALFAPLGETTPPAQ